MRQLLITIAAVLLVGCAASKKQNIWEAVAANDTDTIVMLIAHGQNVNAKNRDGKTPLHVANYDAKISSYLIKNGADINAMDKLDCTPLFFNKQS